MCFQEAARSLHDNSPVSGVEDAALLREKVELVACDRQDPASTRVYDLDLFDCKSQAVRSFDRFGL